MVRSSCSQAVKKAIQAQQTYLQQLMKTQRMRGVTAGNIFYSMIGESPQEMETEAPPSRAKKAGTAVRTLSTLECRQIKDMGSDVEQFARRVGYLV